jgi:hypothetical protein
MALLLDNYLSFGLEKGGRKNETRAGGERERERETHSLKREDRE